jgi:hypothetical protein
MTVAEIWDFYLKSKGSSLIKNSNNYIYFNDMKLQYEPE